MEQAYSFMRDGGQLGSLMRAKDWTRTPVGSVEQWPAALRTALSLMLLTPRPMCVAWGRELTFFYNDAYIPLCGADHPDHLGRPMPQVHAEGWHGLRAIVDAVLAGKAQSRVEHEVAGQEAATAGQAPRLRFSYTPLLDEQGRVAGLMGIANDDTENASSYWHSSENVDRRRRLFDHASSFVSTTRGPEHRFEYVNEAWRTSFRREDVIGRTVLEVFPELAGQGFIELLDHVMATGDRHVARGVPSRIRMRADGPLEVRYVDFGYTPMFDDEHRVTGVFCEGNDVTDEYLAESALRFREEQLRLATEAANIGLWDVDPITGTMFWSREVNAMFGISLGVPVSLQDFYAGLHPNDLERTAASFARACDPAVRTPYDVEYRTVGREDGVIRWVAARGRAVFDDDGRCVRVIGIAVDITERKVSEAALKASEERLNFLDSVAQATRGLTDATAVMAVTARLLGTTMKASRCAYADVEPDNDRFTIRSDWSVEGVPSSAGVYSLDLFGPQATSNMRQGRQLVINDVDREIGDEAGGRMFNAIGIKALICAGLVKEGRLVAMMAVHQSTPRRWTEQDVALVGEVVDRCWAHIERVRSNAMLLEQDRRKDVFLATLAHELRNPLAPMKYAIAILRKTDDAAHRGRAQDVIDRQATHLSKLIDDLLDVSRISRGLIQLKRERVDLGALMRLAAETAKPLIESARHRLTLQAPDDELTIDADPTRVAQIIDNLLTNAAKYTPDGGEIRLAAWRAGRNAVIEVSDNGVGIPHDQQGRLFQMFSQLHHTVGRAKGGLGIGLALVKTLTEMHGGRVSMHSGGLDEGSTFTVELPLAQTVESIQPFEIADVALSGASRGRRILVVEDNPDGLETLTMLLTTMGYRVAGAADGFKALDMAANFKPHLVLLDLGLPGIDGYEVARRLRADPVLRSASIVALTGWGAEQDRIRTAQAGFDAHLTKPVELRALQEVVEARLRAVG